jgi:hypothetical protein
VHYPDLDELDSFPTITDFAVVLRESDEGGQHAVFEDASGVELATFPGWDHVDRDLRHFITDDIPLGTHEEPYDDADEGWRIQIFEHGGFVYVLQGDDPAAHDFGDFFRVPLDQYMQAWTFLIDAFNPVTPLDES